MKCTFVNVRHHNKTVTSTMSINFCVFSNLLSTNIFMLWCYYSAKMHKTWSYERLCIYKLLMFHNSKCHTSFNHISEKGKGRCKTKLKTGTYLYKMLRSGVNVTKPSFSSSLKLGKHKIECLSLTDLVSLIKYIWLSPSAFK